MSHAPPGYCVVCRGNSLSSRERAHPECRKLRLIRERALAMARAWADRALSEAGFAPSREEFKEVVREYAADLRHAAGIGSGRQGRRREGGAL